MSPPTYEKDLARIRDSQPIRVLIADDDPVIRRLLASTVTKEGFVAVQVDDGGKAYKILRADANFAAAIFDMRMPYRDRSNQLHEN